MSKSEDREGGSFSSSKRGKYRASQQQQTSRSAVCPEVGDLSNTQNHFEIRCLYPRRINSEFLSHLPVKRYSGNIALVETEEALDENLPLILNEKILGFDTETRPSFQKGKNYKVSVLQLAGESIVWIIRLKPLENRLGDLFEILESTSIKKVGIAVQGDVRSLRSLREFKASAFVDISEHTSKMGIINTGMRNLTALVFGEKISKKEQCSNWANDSLSDAQISYAATDAWMSRRLYLEVMEILRQNRTDVEPEPDPEPEKFNLKKFIGGVIKKFKNKIKGLSKASSKKGSSKKRHYGKRKKSGKDGVLNKSIEGAKKRKNTSRQKIKSEKTKGGKNEGSVKKPAASSPSKKQKPKAD